MKNENKLEYKYETVINIKKSFPNYQTNLNSISYKDKTDCIKNLSSNYKNTISVVTNIEQKYESVYILFIIA
jgi:hypothetical protein